MPTPTEQTLTAAEARLDACVAAHTALLTNLERLGMLPIPAAETALDDVHDLIAIVGAKLTRAWAAIDEAIEPIRAANDAAEHEAWIVSQEAA
jgi:hypothetical protein